MAYSVDQSTIRIVTLLSNLTVQGADKAALLLDFSALRDIRGSRDTFRANKMNFWDRVVYKGQAERESIDGTEALCQSRQTNLTPNLSPPGEPCYFVTCADELCLMGCLNLRRTECWRPDWSEPPAFRPM